MEVPTDRNHDGPSPGAGSVNDVAPTSANEIKEGDNEVIYYADEPHPPGKTLFFYY